MGEQERTTIAAIHKAATAEFLEKGFKSASLRNIVKTAGVTTGALYGYYDSKEGLFEALVGEQYDYFMLEYKNAQQQFVGLSKEEQLKQVSDISLDCMKRLFVYANDNLNAFKLILLCSEGTRFSGMIDEMADIETKGTHKFYSTLETIGHPVKYIEPHLEHILITGMFKAYFEMIIHEIPPDEALLYIEQLHGFYMAGWAKITGQD
ncbi:MAG: TetR/AcrR family transcriptional regulator [Firmicutes bacterium]|nr:TetR/AcrR family transcriptional regulator [Bacillota bacterium]